MAMKTPAQGKTLSAPVFKIFQFHAGHLVLFHVENFRHGGIPNRFDFCVRVTRSAMILDARSESRR
jgi:hypothetical protein